MVPVPQRAQQVLELVPREPPEPVALRALKRREAVGLDALIPQQSDPLRLLVEEVEHLLEDRDLRGGAHGGRHPLTYLVASDITSSTDRSDFRWDCSCCSVAGRDELQPWEVRSVPRRVSGQQPIPGDRGVRADIEVG